MDSLRSQGKVSPARKRWVNTDEVEAIHFAHPPGSVEGEGADEAMGVNHVLSLIHKGDSRNKISMDLSESTLEEIDVLKQFFDKVFAEAREVCEHRDKLVQEAFDNGEDTHYRLYRPVPVMVER